MALTSGTKLGPYEIVAPLGAGGMGEVYRAHDARLDREVAIKVLPGSLSSDASLKQRLEREAKAVSKLSHPHICTLHDIGHQDGIDFLVMELVEGETLEQRLTRGPLPPEQTIRYSAQIADALAKAHKMGITHRDLKPANIMLTKAGAKLMDFGLAKQSGPAPLAAALTEMTVEQSKLTTEGSIVGTFQYMAPEQLEGKEADARTDIFAFGELIHEMATGKPAFAGKSRASLIAAILTTEPPPITQLQPLTPPALERVVKKCLAKDPDERWQSASDLASELKWIQESGSQAGTAHRAPAKAGRRIRLPWPVTALAIAVVAVAVAVASYSYFRPNPQFAHRARWIVAPPGTTSFQATGDSGGPVALSPDGRRFAFVAADANGKTQLWVQAVDALKATPLAGTEGAAWPFWSPDGRSIGFFAHGQLKRIDVDGGSALNLCDVRVARGGSWGADGTIVFAPHVNGGIYRIAASGGQPVAVTRVDVSQHDSHRWPYFLPDGKHFLYFAAAHMDISHSRDGLYVASLDGKESKLLLRTHANAAYANGRMLYLNDDVLMAQAFDLRHLEVMGEPVVVQPGVEQYSTWWLAVFSVSQNGVLAFVPNQNPGNQLVWLGPDGKNLSMLGEAGRYTSLRLSPDDQQVAVEHERPEHAIWIHDIKRNTSTQFTSGPSASGLPVWSPDSSQIIFASQQGGHNDLHAKSVAGAQAEEVLLQSNAYNFPLDWSPDGNFLLYLATDATNEHPGLWALPMHGPRTPRLLLQAPIYDSDGRFSPDMHWIVYTSREQGQQKVFVAPFPVPGPRLPISPAGGASPLWRQDGKAILYVDDAGDAVEETEVHESGSELVVGKTRRLPQALKVAVFQGVPIDRARDGRILVVSREAENRSQLVVVTNWDEGLKH